MRNIFTKLILAFIALVFVSCDKDMKGTTFNGESGVAFATTVYSYEMLPEDGNVIKVPIYRDKADGQKNTVDLQLVDTKNLFSLKSTRVTFTEGSLIAYAEVAYADINALSPTSKYSMTLSITNTESLSPSNRNKIVVTVNRKLTFEEIGSGSIISQFEEGESDFIVKKAKEGEVYQLIDPYEKLIAGYKKGIVIQFSVAANNTVTFTDQPIGDFYDGSAINMTDLKKSTRDGKVITLVCKFTIPGLSLAFNGEFVETVTLP